MTKEFDILSTKNVMFHLYGPVEASVDGVRFRLGTEKERRMVVPLLLNIRRPVSYLELADWMWDGSPSSAPDDLGQHMGEFRTKLAHLGLRGALVNRDRVCRLNVLPSQVDVHRLSAVLREVEGLDDRAAAGRLREALALCDGEPLAGLCGHRIDSCRQTLRGERRRAELTLIRVEFRLGYATHRLPDLIRLFQERPEDPEVATLTMRALAGAGRQAEALAVHRRCCERLIELGMKVPEEMSRLHLHILRDDEPAAEERELERHR
jgi:DNA-binding SARP family transcriptional activator